MRIPAEAKGVQSCGGGGGSELPLWVLGIKRGSSGRTSRAAQSLQAAASFKMFAFNYVRGCLSVYRKDLFYFLII